MQKLQKGLSTFGALKHISSRGMTILEGEKLAECRRILLEMLRDVDEVCERNGIPYTLCGGTALGAVRHGGMIPWDDDIDVAMFREDLNRFLPLFRQAFGEHYWIHTPEETKGYPKLFVQVRKKGTLMRELEDLTDGEWGIPLDIFPMENTYDSALLRRLHGLLCLGMKFGLSCRKIRAERETLLGLTEETQARRAIRIKAAIGRVLSFASLEAWTRGTIACCKRCKRKGKWVVIPSGRGQFFGEIYERAAMAEGTRVPFERQSARLTDAADAYLRQLYGVDYMKVPPEEKREHHAVLAFDPGTGMRRDEG